MFRGVIKNIYGYIMTLDKYEEYYFNSLNDNCKGIEFTNGESIFLKTLYLYLLFRFEFSWRR